MATNTQLPEIGLAIFALARAGGHSVPGLWLHGPTLALLVLQTGLRRNLQQRRPLTSRADQWQRVKSKIEARNQAVEKHAKKSAPKPGRSGKKLMTKLKITRGPMKMYRLTVGRYVCGELIHDWWSRLPGYRGRYGTASEARAHLLTPILKWKDEWPEVYDSDNSRVV